MAEAEMGGNWVSRAVRRQPYGLLLLFCLALWLPGFWTLPPLDRDESRFAEASKQMIETGNLVDIRYGKEARYKKPVGIYWLQAAATGVVDAVTGASDNAIWTYRIPSLIGASAAVAGVFWCASAVLGVETAFLAALLLGATLLLSAEAKIAKTDATQLAMVVWAEAVLMRVYLSARDAASAVPSRGLALLGWMAFAGGILIKGPVILGVVAATVLLLCLWDRDVKWLARTQPLWGIPLTLLLVLPWFVAILVASHGQFFQQSLGTDFGSKLVGGQETHGAPPGYYLLLTTLSFWPSVLFLAPGLGAAVARRGEPVMRFLLCWAVGFWLVVEAVPTKLPHYVMPIYPALAILAAAWAVASREEGLPPWRRILPWVGLVQFLIGALLLGGGISFLPGHFGMPAPIWLIGGAGTVMLFALVVAGMMVMKKLIWAAAGGTVCAIGFYGLLMFGVAPRLQQIWVSPRVAALVAKNTQPNDPPPTLVGYQEPSLVFALGADTQLLDARDAADSAVTNGGLVLIEDREAGPFRARLAELEGDATQVDELSGFNYSRGQKVHITLYRVVPHDGAALPKVR